MKWVLLLLLVSVLPGPAAAGLRQWGDVIYPLPPDWTEGSRSTTHATLLADLAEGLCDNCRLYIGPGAPGRAASVLGQYGQVFWAERIRRDMKPLGPARETRFGRRNLILQVWTDRRKVYLAVAVPVADRVQLFGFEGPGRGEDQVAASLAAFALHGGMMIGLMRFESEGAPPLLPAPRPGDLDGIWRGWTQDSRLGVDGMLRLEVSFRTLFFYRSGRFVQSGGPFGTGDPDIDWLRQRPWVVWGNYTRNGDRLELTYADGRREELTRDGRGWKDRKYSLVRVVPVADGTRIDGQVETIHWSGFAPGTGLTGGGGGGNRMRLRRDGTWEGSRWSNSFAGFESGGGYASGGSDISSGSYEIRDGILILTERQTGEIRWFPVVHFSDGIMVGDEFLR